jgi:hypothetical protein
VTCPRIGVPGLPAVDVQVLPMTRGMCFLCLEFSQRRRPGAAAYQPRTARLRRTPRTQESPLRGSQALHTVILVRLRCDDASRAYALRRRTEGKTDRDFVDVVPPASALHSRPAPVQLLLGIDS